MSFNPLDHPICLETPQRLSGSNAWAEHIPFAFFIVDLLKPKVLVELGTYAGNSYCAFCQAIQTLKLDTKAYAVDTWEGDEHGGYYGPEILADLQSHHDPNYASFSRLLQMTFDEAKAYFSDGTIDLLHIDGLHTYDAVKHDFENWLPKLSDQAIVLFHDINVRERGFGVWKFWEEVKRKYHYLEFFHGNGLGVLTISGSFPREIEDQIKIDSGNLLRLFFSVLGEKYISSFEKKALQQQISEVNDQLLKKTEELSAVNEISTATIANLDNKIQSLSEKLALKNVSIEKAQSKQQSSQAEIEVLSRQLHEAQIEICKYVNSSSWALTRPVRKIIKKLRGY